MSEIACNEGEQGKQRDQEQKRKTANLYKLEKQGNELLLPVL